MKNICHILIVVAFLFFSGNLQASKIKTADKDLPQGMVIIPAGPFWMGIDELPPDTPWGQKDSKPKHEVSLPTFYIDQHEVTHGAYQKFEPEMKIPDRTPDIPMTHVTWHDADRYCHSLGKRLPTEAEWEKAARGTDGRAYPWGNKFELKLANTGAAPMPVGSFPKDKSPYGVFDMAGNVSEWTDTWYRAYPGNTFPSEDYGIFQKVVRGGSFNVNRHFADDMFAQVTFRNYNRPHIAGPDNGFRCAQSLLN
ncbi:MAG: SUMF1/EgtB/PvdO family nonheme iron enzyme [Nitrospira sp.]|nr:hypothetical protein [Candidatus Manganitrophaceae bacterium]HIL33998.1 hypothetical protein [Candidatus Manganitrophaceae bacterium]